VVLKEAVSGINFKGGVTDVESEKDRKSATLSVPCNLFAAAFGKTYRHPFLFFSLPFLSVTTRSIVPDTELLFDWPPKKELVPFFKVKFIGSLFKSTCLLRAMLLEFQVDVFKGISFN